MSLLSFLTQPAPDPPLTSMEQEDAVSGVSRVLSDVQQARADLELQCALTEAEEEYTDMSKLLQSTTGSEE